MTKDKAEVKTLPIKREEVLVQLDKAMAATNEHARFIFLDNRHVVAYWQDALTSLERDGTIETKINEIETQYSRLEIRYTDKGWKNRQKKKLESDARSRTSKKA